MKRTCHRIGIATLLVLALLALPSGGVLAEALDDAKRTGSVGERPDGYLGAVDEDAGAEVKALVEEINGKRRERYREIAEKRPDAEVWPTFYGDALVLGKKFFAMAREARQLGLSNMVLNSNGSFCRDWYIDEILTCPGPDESNVAQVRGWNFDGDVLDMIDSLNFPAYDEEVIMGGNVTAGVFEE